MPTQVKTLSKQEVFNWISKTPDEVEGQGVEEFLTAPQLGSDYEAIKAEYDRKMRSGPITDIRKAKRDMQRAIGEALGNQLKGKPGHAAFCLSYCGVLNRAGVDNTGDLAEEAGAWAVLVEKIREIGGDMDDLPEWADEALSALEIVIEEGVDTVLPLSTTYWVISFALETACICCDKCRSTGDADDGGLCQNCGGTGLL